jgi:peptidyl-dipeptidase Dcp
MKAIIALLAVVFTISACTNKPTMQENPFFTTWDTPFQAPPFDKIKTEHFKPAFEEAIRLQRVEIDSIASSTEAPTFDNTIRALEYSGALLTKVSNVFYPMTSANTNADIQKIQTEMAPILSSHNDDIYLNPQLFDRVRSVYMTRDELGYSAEQERLLNETYKRFIRAGAALDDNQKSRLREINSELSQASVAYGANVLAETNSYQLHITNESDLAGLPQGVKDAAAETATKSGKDGWVFTLQAPSLTPFMQYAENRDLRKQLYEAYLQRGDNGDDKDNKALVKKMAELRAERASLLGYPNHAAYVLEEAMAANPENVYNLINRLWSAATPKFQQEAVEMKVLAAQDGISDDLKVYDWFFYAEKLRKERYAIDAETVREYFPIDQVTSGLFDVVNKLWGITLKERTDLPVYHEEVRVYEVFEADGSHRGLVYMDFFPRESKRGGAWMTSFRKQYVDQSGNYVHPIVTIVGNFRRPSGDAPALLSFDEVTTYYHEFGHALHGLLSDRTYQSLTGTAVPRDFVELPSQIMENWPAEPEVMKSFSKHYKTGETIPDELIDKMQASQTFNQGYNTVQYLAAAFLDMDYHTISAGTQIDADAFEAESMKKIGIDPSWLRYRSTFFNHIFSGGYSSGYYSYIWSEILDSDAFEAFKQRGLFDQATAQAFRTHILEAGNTEDPMQLYVKFRGSEPSIDALLKKRGLN